MAVTVYKSSDTSAPTLSGTAGSLIGVLDACLVNGYGSKTAAGWTKPFSGTNTAVYLPSAGHYLDFNDNAAGTGGAKEATVRGYETMTAVATGTGPFPTTSQVAAPGLFIHKSATADATARGWVVLADSTTFYLFILSGDTAGLYESFGFGRFYSFKTGDTYRTIILGGSSTGAAVSAGLNLTATAQGSSSQATNNGVYYPRGQSGTGTSTQGGLFGIGVSVYPTPFTGPNLADGNIYLSRLFLGEGGFGSRGLRGFIRGVYQAITSVGLNDGDTFTGSGDFAGRTFLVLNKLSNGPYLALETSAWDSSS